MTYDAVKGKGVQARGSTGRKIFINKEADYSNVLERVREELYGPSCGEGINQTIGF